MRMMWKAIGKAHGWKHPRAEGPRVEASEGGRPTGGSIRGRRQWKEKSTKAVLEMLRDTRIGYISSRQVVPAERLGEEMAGPRDEGKEGGPCPANMKFPFFLLFWGAKEIGPFLLLSFGYSTSLLCSRGRGRRRKGRPAMIDNSDLHL